MPTTNDLINSTYQETWTNAQACQEYEEWLDAEDARRKALADERRRMFELWTRTSDEMDEYDEDDF